MCWTKSRNNKQANRLLKQKVQQDFEFREYGVKPMRHKSYVEQTYDMGWYDLPRRSNDFPNWKRHRKTQYKA